MKDRFARVSRWMEGGGPEPDTVLSSRVRLARNLAGCKFPCLAAEQETAAVLDQVREYSSGVQELSGLPCHTMADMTSIEKQALVDKHLISPLLAGQEGAGALLLREDETVGIMVNEEDHLRIQVILPGLQLEEAWQEAARYDDLLENGLDYAFDEHYGYLAACPTNIGTALRVSAMLHLPALIMTGRAQRFLGAVSRVGLAVRGLYGEGTEIVGGLVQISNQATLGQPEEEIIDNLAGVIRQIIEQELDARQKLLDKKRAALADRAWRALGLLRHAQLLGSQEAMRLLSDLRLGYDLGLIKTVHHRLLNELLVVIRPGFLQVLAGRELDQNERSLERPLRIREVLESA